MGNNDFALLVTGVNAIRVYFRENMALNQGGLMRVLRHALN